MFLLHNESFPRTVEFFEKFENKLRFNELSRNKSLPWTIELIERFEDKWNWEYLSVNRSLPWTIAVSYTHLDVYKRQLISNLPFGMTLKLLEFD